MNITEPTRENVFTYSLWSGQFRVYKGKIFPTCSKNYCRFTADHVHKILGCAPEEGVVYNNVVWLSKRDDTKAREILINDAVRKISAHEEHIENLKVKISQMAEIAILK